MDEIKSGKKTEKENKEDEEKDEKKIAKQKTKDHTQFILSVYLNWNKGVVSDSFHHFFHIR